MGLFPSVNDCHVSAPNISLFLRRAALTLPCITQNSRPTQAILQRKCLLIYVLIYTDGSIFEREVCESTRKRE